MTDVTFASQQFAADRQDHASAARMQGAQAIGQGIAQAPVNFLQAQAHQTQQALAQAQIATEELRRQELGQKIQTVAQLNALGMQKIQRDSAALGVEQQRFALDRAKKAAEPGTIDVKDAFREFVAAKGEPIFVGDQVLSGYDFTTRKPTTREPTAEDLKAREQQRLRGQSLADPRNLRLTALKALTEIKKAQGSLGFSPETAAAMAPIEQALRDFVNNDGTGAAPVPASPPLKRPDQAGIGTDESLPVGTDEQRGAEAWQKAAEQRAIQQPHLRALFAGDQGENQASFQGFQRAVASYAGKRGMSLAQATGEVTNILEKNPEAMAKFLIGLDYNDEQIARYFKLGWSGSMTAEQIHALRGGK